MTRRSAALKLVLALSFCHVALAQPTGTFTPTGNMATPRVRYTATLLPDGKVLIAGGQTPTCCVSTIFSSAELYDPSTGSFMATGDMTTPRSGHTATLLPDGKVLIAGGFFTVNTTQGLRPISHASAELYDPATGTFSATGDMVNSGGYGVGTAILLEDGRVLIAHGYTAELYDPVTRAFSSSGPPLYSWDLNTRAALLPDGRVLLVTCCGAGQLYDPVSGTFSRTDETKRIYEDGYAAAALTNGTVLFAGGQCEECARNTPIITSGAELYDPSLGSFRTTGEMTTGRQDHTATLLPDGTVLIAGGQFSPLSNPAASTSAEIYDPTTGVFSRTGDMNYPHAGHTATLLLDGSVLVTGGWYADLNPASNEVYTPSILMPIPVVKMVRFDRVVVPAGSSFSVDLSGSNLTTEMFFDVRFISPESNHSSVALNWQKGLAASHDVPASLAPGSWTINGVRAHEIETDHTGSFFPVSATITVSP